MFSSLQLCLPAKVLTDVRAIFQEVGYGSELEMPTKRAEAPEAIAGPECTAFHIESTENNNSARPRVLAHWDAFMTNDGCHFYISAPSAVCSSSKQSLVSLLEIAESFGCSTAWMFVDRQRPDFVTVVAAFKYLGFQLSQNVFKDTSANKIYALLRYELE
jgi:hypothetical protein